MAGKTRFGNRKGSGARGGRIKVKIQVTAEKSQIKAAADAPDALSDLIPLCREIGNLKRIRAAESNDSRAARMFERAWSKIIGGEAVRGVAVSTVAEAVCAANLGAIDWETLRRGGLSDDEIETVLQRAFDAVAAPIDENFRVELRGQIRRLIGETPRQKTPIKFVELLKNQPRSGATKVGAPKRIFDAPENHAEHCLSVAVVGALLADRFAADVETVFLIGLMHHFHNAYLPDSGFAGEEALGGFLPRVFDSFRRECLREVPENLREIIQKQFVNIETADTPEAKAFHAADVFDRVLQMLHHAEANEFTLRYAMEEAELVHAGAVRDFHYDVLRRAKLIV